MTNAENVCVFSGRVSSDPQYATHQGQNGQPFESVKFSIAVNRALTSQQRQAAKNDPSIVTADFVNLEASGSVVTSLIKPYVVKGKAIIVRTHYNTWKGTNQQTGQTTYGHSFVIDEISFAPQDAQYLNNGGGGNGGGAGGGYQQNNNNYNNNYQQNQNRGNGGYQQNNPAPQQQNAGFAMFDDDTQPF